MTNTPRHATGARPALWMLLILLPLSTLADSALSPAPILKHGACPSGYSPSGAYCVPGSKARLAIDKLGACPSGYTPSGAYCLAGSQARAAIAKIGSSCPSGWSPSGAYCLRRR
ncbi:hypothetical protein HW932_13050 [Allochromatium humboldtianum]|uniref:Uncharacterized protein n=1 Tax=Allochromatium humboldtianum TaxID=504901 RepID=A0A850R670_9GAMM|nr:hypothetical protein [Allochromatium humboldtianum]NVZ10189.1 hypothetical protein [Allochromatium humboldtianum]